MEQIIVRIGDIDVPVIVDGGEEWFPCVFVAEKVLLRKARINFNKNYISKYSIDYGFDTGGIQEVNCISKSNLSIELKKTKVGWLSIEQRKAQNNLHKYFGMELLAIDEQDTEYYDPKWLDELDDYTKDVVQEEMENSVDWHRRCSSCNKSLPMMSRFYPLDARADKGYSKVCKVCLGKVEYFKPITEKFYFKSEDLLNAIREENIEFILKAYSKGKIKRIPDCYENREGYLKIIEYLFKQGHIHHTNLTLEKLTKYYKLKNISKYLKVKEIYIHLFGNNFMDEIWKFPSYHYNSDELSYEKANYIIRNYLNMKNLEISDPLNYNYGKLIKDCRVHPLANKDLIYFVVQLNNFKYAGYSFKINSPKYYQSDENVLFDLRYLIEQDLNLSVEKIPLYLTKNTLYKNCKPLYNYIITKKNGSIFSWVNQLYPNRFNEMDFDINAYRETFDSQEECFINELLKENLPNVLYNQRNTDRTITLQGMIPDWIIITEDGTWVVEYFGLYREREYDTNYIVRTYMDNTKQKIEKYKTMKNLKYLFIYPNDIEDDFKGCREKIAKMKEM